MFATSDVSQSVIRLSCTLRLPIIHSQIHRRLCCCINWMFVYIRIRGCWSSETLKRGGRDRNSDIVKMYFRNTALFYIDIANEQCQYAVRDRLKYIPKNNPCNKRYSLREKQIYIRIYTRCPFKHIIINYSL